MELADFARLGDQIAEKSLALKSEREKAAHILRGIKALEDELRPLVEQHAKMVAEMLGSVAPPTVIAPAPYPVQPTQKSTPGMNFGSPTGANPVIESAKQRIRQYIRSSEDGQQDTAKGISATSVAEALGVDSGLVREVLFEMSRGR